MRSMFKLIGENLAAGEDLVLVTVIASSGSTPRGSGARMLIGKKGRLTGTIGGGTVEYRSEQIAAEILENKRSGEHNFTLTKDDVENLGMICGGAVGVFFYYIPAGDKKTTPLQMKWKNVSSWVRIFGLLVISLETATRHLVKGRRSRFEIPDMVLKSLSSTIKN